MEAKKKAEKEQKSEYIVDYFMNILERAICDCKDELIERFNWICAQNPASAKFMYENNTFFSYGDDFKNEGIRGALKHGTLAIGQLGMAECLQILIGCDHCYPKGMEIAKRIESLFKSKCAEYKEEWRMAPIYESEVYEKMILKAEENLGRSLKDSEKKEIKEYCNKNSKAFTPA